MIVSSVCKEEIRVGGDEAGRDKTLRRHFWARERQFGGLESVSVEELWCVTWTSLHLFRSHLTHSVLETLGSPLSSPLLTLFTVAENLLGAAIGLLHFMYGVAALLTTSLLREVKSPAWGHPRSESTIQTG